MIRKAFVAVLFCMLSLSHAVLADDMTPEKRADIKALMQMSGFANLGNQFADFATIQIVQRLQASGRKDLPKQTPQAVHEELVVLFKEQMSAPGGLAERIEPIYGRYFSHQEVKDLIAFYKTPLGQKFLGSMPSVTRESVQQLQAWSNALGPTIESRVKVRLKKEGVDLDKKPEPEQKPDAEKKPGPSKAPESQEK